MSTNSDIYSTTGPNKALSRDQLDQIETLVSTVEEIPTISEEELTERFFRKNPQARFWADEYQNAHRMLQSDHQPPRCKLPGFGEKYEDCGARIPHACKGCGHEVEIGRTCARSECPRCGAAWVLKRVPKIATRINEAAKMKEGRQFKHHGVISPPKDLFIDAEDKDEALEHLFEFGHSFMDACDMDGVMIYHAYRGKSESTDFREAHEDDRGEWKDRVFSGRSWDDVRDELEFSPHLHVIGSCEWFPGQDVTATIYENTGWVIHRITERNGSAVSLGNVHSLARALTYCFSHVGIDMSGERNKSLYRKHGSAFHAADCRSLDQVKQACHRVAPDTLGVPSMYIECRNEVDCDHEHHEHLEDLDDDGSAAESDRTSESDSTTTCRGDLCDMDDVGELLDNNDWCQSIPPVNLSNLEETHQTWIEVGGWRGWIEREQSSVDDFNPPPD